MSSGEQAPVIFIVFNRPETTQQVFEALRQARPAKLLVVADGPRPARVGEAAICEAVRAIATAVDWPCELFTNFAETNLGCDARVISGLNWAFSLVDEAIILEDDCLPDPSFFPFCSELLERYRDDDRIAAISGTNLVQDQIQINASYCFSLLGGSWGWATWRSQWTRLHHTTPTWPALRQSASLEQVFDDARGRRLWMRIFDEIHLAGERSPWDYRWIYTRIFEHRLTIVPRNNLIRNIGFGPDASHTTYADRRHSPALRRMSFPLQHPPGMVWSRAYDRVLQTRLDYDFMSRVLSRIRKVKTNFESLVSALSRWSSTTVSPARQPVAPVYKKKDA